MLKSAVGKGGEYRVGVCRMHEIICGTRREYSASCLQMYLKSSCGTEKGVLGQLSAGCMKSAVQERVMLKPAVGKGGDETS